MNRPIDDDVEIYSSNKNHWQCHVLLERKSESVSAIECNICDRTPTDTMGNPDNTDEKHEDNASAAKTTAFSANIRRMVIPLAVTLLASILGLPLYIAVLPYLVVITRMFKSEPGETRLQWWSKYAIMQVFYCGLLLMASVIVLFPIFEFKITGYHFIAFYLPMITIAKHDRRKQYGLFATVIVQNFFDVPLVIAGYVCREFFGLRMLAPFCNIIDDTIVQGSMPFPSDIATLAAEPYNVGLIINMCREYKGATHEMRKHGIAQCHLPHQDTTAVSYESLVTGCAYIRQFRKHNPNKRVFVHCKGGIGRASTMTLGHFVKNEGRDPEEAIVEMKAKRHVVFTGVKDYPGILRLNKERLIKQKIAAGKEDPKKQR